MGNTIKKYIHLTFIVLLIIGCNRDNTELYNKACDLEEQGKYKEAIEFLSKALELNPKDIECYNNRAWDYYDLGEFNKSMADFKSLLEIDSVNTAAIYGIGFLCYEQKQYQKAINNFDKIIKLKGGGPLFLELTNNEFIGQRVLEADIEQVYRYKKLAEEKLNN
jgi:tetratricopeptide (TPR) repeat protein